jgi:hypothetical protein
LVNKANRGDLQVMWEYVLNPLEVEDMVKVEVEEYVEIKGEKE